jgi:DNA polymerase-1
MTADLWQTLRNPNCPECELHKTAKTVCLLGDGPVPCKLMGIGEAPGEREDDVRKPFQGKAGREILNPGLRKFGVERSQIYLSNSVKCRPPENDTPTIHHIRACRHYLLSEIEAVQPKKILAFGASAIRTVLNDARASVKSYRGTIIHFPEFPNIPVYPGYHPAASLYDPYNNTLFLEDLERALGDKEVEEHRQDYHVINNLDEAWEVVKRLVQKSTLTLDFETTSLDTLAPDFEILTMGIGNVPGEAYSIACDHPESSLKGQWQYILRYIAEEADVTIGGQNIKYEIKCAKAYRISFKGPLRDTLLEAHALDENYPSKSLLTFKRRFFPWMKLEEDMQHHKKNMRGQILQNLGRYNAEDIDATTRLLRMWKPRLREEGLLPLAQFQAMSSKMLANVEINGMKLDVALLQKNMRIFSQKRDELAAKFPGILLTSPQQVSDYLYKKLGLRILDTTDVGGQGSTAKTSLERLMGTVKGRNHQAQLRDLINFKKVVHFDSHFITGIFNNLTAAGYIHPSYNMAKFEDPKKNRDVGTVTGRLSASLIHQIPRDTNELDKIFGEDAIQIKEMFVSRFNEGCITQADYSQIELRLMAEYSQDENMLKDFDSGVDIHTGVTNRLLTVAPKFYERYPDFDAKRKATKMVNFGIIYLISGWALADKLEVALKEGTDIINSWFKVYPGVKRWLNMIQRDIAEKKYSVSLIGRRRRVPGADFNSSMGREQLRQGVNAPIQGLASDINVMVMWEFDVELERRNLKSLLIGNVHDALLVDTHPDEREEVKTLIEQIAPKPKLLKDLFNVSLRVPIHMDLSQRRTWSKKEDD